MKKSRLLPLFLAAMLTLSMVATPTAFAQGSGSGRPQVTVRTGWIGVNVNGNKEYFWKDARGHRRPLLCEDAVYIPMKTAAAWMGAEVSWNEKEGELTFSETGNGPEFPLRTDAPPDDARYDPYTQEEYDLADQERRGVSAQQLTDAVVTVDGKAQTFFSAEGEQLYPLLYREYVYLPLEGVARLSGLSLLWRTTDGDYVSRAVEPEDDDAVLYTPSTQEDFAQFDAYCAEMLELLERFQAGADELEGREGLTEEAFLTALREELRPIGQAMLDLPLPEHQGIFSYTQVIRFYASDIPEEDVDDFLIPGRPAAQFDFQKKQDRFYSWTDNDIEDVRKAIRTAQVEAAAVAQAAGAPEWTAATQAVREAQAQKQRQMETASRFTDAAQIQHWDAVYTLAALGIIDGKDSGAFDPAAPVTRAEMAKLACAIHYYGQIPKSVRRGTLSVSFDDTQGHWAEGYIDDGAGAGYIEGRGDGTFDPDATVTAAEAAKISLALLYYYAPDFGLSGAKWKENTLTIAGQKKLFANIDAVPDDPMTRDDTAQLLYNTIYACGVVLGENGYYEDDVPYIRGFDLTYLPVSIPAQPR